MLQREWLADRAVHSGLLVAGQGGIGDGAGRCFELNGLRPNSLASVPGVQATITESGVDIRLSGILLHASCIISLEMGRYISPCN